MNISYNWLKDYINFTLSPVELSAKLTSIGLETGSIEEVESIKGGLKGLVIGKVLTCETHPDSDHLHVTSVNIGEEEPKQIVCGAPNVAAGQTVVVATIGTNLYSGDEVFTIKKSKIRGIESFGMICAEDEIGIGNSHDGIIVLNEEIKPGTPASEYYRLENDYVLEVDITPNRIDAASHFGVARDLYACLKQSGDDSIKLNKPSIEDFKIDDPSPAVLVEVENAEACPRYSGVTIKGVEVKESPDWLKKRLEVIGVRSINNIVDITNYILHETGQPLHAFDLKEIKENKVIVKTLPSETPFVTLDEVERKLDERDLMICSTQGAMCIGGVFGGLHSGVTESTTDVFLESAYFNPTWIRKTARRHGLNTDASFRFERGADPNNTVYVLKRAALLIQEIAGGKITGNIQDVYPTLINDTRVELSLQKVQDLIGKKIPAEIIEKIITDLDLKIVQKSNKGWTLDVPTYRVDVYRDVDVIEDILRIYGYNNVEIGEYLKSNLSYQTPTDLSYKLQNLISEQLTGAGFNEILNNSLTSGSYYKDLQTYPQTHSVYLKNPLSSELDVMRQTLLFGGLENIAYNRNHKHPDLKFYEFGNVYFYHSDKAQENNSLAAIKEEFHLSLWVTGNEVVNSWIRANEKTSFYQLRAFVDNILVRLNISPKRLVYKTDSSDLLSSALSIETHSGRKLGCMGIVQKAVSKSFDINAEIYYAELNWSLLMKEYRNDINYTETSKFPTVKRDLALLLDKSVSFAEVQKIAFATDKKILKDVSLFDVYEGKNLPENKKSYAINFVLEDKEKTLTDKQIDSIISRIQKNLEDKLNAQLR